MSNVSLANLYDQYGFKPTGSTTAAHIDLLDTNKYMCRLLTDLSKRRNNAVIVKKLVDIGLDQNVVLISE